MQETKKSTQLPGVFATVAAGFELTSKHLWLLILPVVLDIFLWIGPRLRFEELIMQALALVPDEVMLADLSGQLAEVAPRTNLFTTLSVQLMGVPALMVGSGSEQLPISPTVVEVASWSNWVLLFLVFTFTGLLLTAIYYTMVGAVVSKNTSTLDGAQWLRQTLVHGGRLLGLALAFLLMVLVVYIPLMVMGTIMFLISSALASLVILIGPFLVMWIVIYLSLAPAGIVINERPVFRAMIESARMVQTHLRTALLLFLTLLLGSTLLDWVLLLAETGTWLTLVNIAGHAFVSTAFLAALFIFYRDRYRMLHPQ